ncbi:MAG: hypothetical protein CM15mP120_08760 [Pseudomonadota bacterium]|nr:MAG: hypothetical protein CM15mP120_08760 [Pseudomonadota bacterium]
MVSKNSPLGAAGQCVFLAGACIPVTYGTAHDALFEFGRLRADETVLVQGGAGGVGIACIRWRNKLVPRCTQQLLGMSD